MEMWALWIVAVAKRWLLWKWYRCGSTSTVYEGVVEAQTIDPLDAQQAYVGAMLLPHGERLEKAENYGGASIRSI
jgi:hypothetical protein